MLPEIAKDIFTLIIKTSLEKQENQKLNTSGYGSAKKALVIGGLGKMGQWFVRFLGQQEFNVDIADINSDGHSDIVVGGYSRGPRDKDGEVSETGF